MRLTGAERLAVLQTRGHRLSGGLVRLLLGLEVILPAERADRLKRDGRGLAFSSAARTSSSSIKLGSSFFFFCLRGLAFPPSFPCEKRPNKGC